TTVGTAIYCTLHDAVFALTAPCAGPVHSNTVTQLHRRPPGPASRHRTRALALLLVACGGATALAAPLAPMRAPRAAIPRGVAPALRASPLERACGSDIDGLAQAYAAAAEHAALTGLVPQPTPHSLDTGEIAVLEDDGTFFFTDKNGNVNLDL